jgi:hypothetical protein
MKKDELDALFAEAEAKTDKIDDQSKSKKSRDVRLLDCNKPKTVLFRMFMDTKGKVLNLPYNFNSFKSPIDGKNVPLGISRTLWDGEPDYIKKFQTELWGNGQNDLAKLLYPKERSRVNIFCLSDSSDEAAEKTFKVWEYSNKPVDAERPRTGSPFNKFLKEIFDDPENEVTKRQLFSLDFSGVTIKMVITKGDDPWPEFKFSIYTGKKDDFFKKITPEKAGILQKEKGSDLLSMLEQPKIDAELDKILKTRLLGVSVGAQTSARTEAPVGFDDDEDDDDIPMSHGSSEDTVSESSETSSKGNESDDAEFDNLMKEFDMEDE